MESLLLSRNSSPLDCDTTMVKCPYYIENQCPDPHPKPLQISQYVALPAILSCTFSCIGSILIVYTYCRWKDIRTGSRKIITYLSIADFCTAFGYILGSLNYLINFGQKKSCSNFHTVCQIQSFITTTSSMSSFVWTTMLAIYLYISVVHNEGNRAQRFFPLLHVLAWGAPLIITVPILATGNLGYSSMAVSTWCYIQTCSSDKGIFLIMVAGKFWEILCYLLVFFFYILIKIHLRRQVADTKNPGVLSLLRKSDRKLIFVPIMFVLLRMWGTLQFFFTLGVDPKHSYCVGTTIYVVFTIFCILQAIGDGGQGWGNFVLYILASDKIRNRLLRCRGDHTNEFKQPILSEHGMEDSTSNIQIKKYGGTVNNVDVSAVPTTV